MLYTISFFLSVIITFKLIECSGKHKELAIAINEIRSIRASYILSKDGELYYEKRIPDRERTKFPSVVYVPELLTDSATRAEGKLKIIAYSYIDDKNVVVLNGDLNIIQTNWNNVYFSKGIPTLVNVIK